MPRPSSAACLLALAACAGLAAPARAADPGPVTMAAHHALYKLTLLSGKGANAPASAIGGIDYDFSGSACDGYTTHFRQLVEIQPSEGDSKLNDMTSNTFENGVPGRVAAPSDIDTTAQPLATAHEMPDRMPPSEPEPRLPSTLPA